VLDRVLDKGLVIEGWVRVRPLGIGLIAIEAGAVVESLEASLKSSAIAQEENPSETLPPPWSHPVVARVAMTPFCVRLRCEQGCTFERESPLAVKTGARERVPCAVDPRRLCAVKGI
jgi:hypothetical protein